METSITKLVGTDLDKAIASIKARGARIEHDIHVAAYSTLCHIAEHGNTTQAAALLNALPQGMRVKGLAAWYKGMSNGMLHFHKDKATKQWKATLEKDRKLSDFDLIKAETVTFATYTEEKDPQQTTIETLRRYLKRLAENTSEITAGVPAVAEDARKLAASLLAAVPVAE